MRKVVYLVFFALFAVGIYVFIAKKETMKAPEAPVTEVAPVAAPSEETANVVPETENSQAAAQSLGQLSDFTLTNQDGKEFRLSEMKGQVLLLNFFFTKCEGPCPIMNKRMEALQGKFANEPKIKLVSVSVDPTNDTPEVLKAYSQKFNAVADKWFFLTGSKEAVSDLMEKQLRFAGGEAATHTTVFVLLDQNGAIKGFYDSSSEEELAKAEKDALQLAASSAA